MRLKMGTFHITSVEECQKTSLEKGVLRLNTSELQALILQDETILEVRIELVYPGESARIVHVLDAVEPRVKVEGPSCCFPGFLGLPLTAGHGTTHRLTGVAVLAISTEVYKPAETDVLSCHEGIIEMSGPGQDRCTCSDTINVCLCLRVRPNTSSPEFDTATRMAMLKAADYIARTTVNQTPDSVEEFEAGNADPDLPRVAYINQIQSQSLLCRTYLYGMPMEGFYTTTLLDPTELLDGAVVNSNLRNQLRACTYMQQNNFVVLELFKRHRKDLNFVGMVMSRGHYDDNPMKVRSGNYAAKLAKLMNAQAAILTIEGTGNANVDYMATVKALENASIIAVPIAHEFGGPKGDDEPLFEFPPEAVSVVSGGGVDRFIELPAVNRVVGGATMSFSDASVSFKELDPKAALRASAHYFFCGFRSLQTHAFRAMEF